MPDGRQIEETLRAPLAALEDLIRAPAEALRGSPAAQPDRPNAPACPRSRSRWIRLRCSGDRGWLPSMGWVRNWSGSPSGEETSEETSPNVVAVKVGSTALIVAGIVV